MGRTTAYLSEPAGSGARSDGSLAGPSLSRHPGHAPGTTEQERIGNCPVSRISTRGEACSLSWPSARPCPSYGSSTNEAIRSHRQLCARGENTGRALPGSMPLDLTGNEFWRGSHHRGTASTLGRGGHSCWLHYVGVWKGKPPCLPWLYKTALN